MEVFWWQNHQFSFEYDNLTRRTSLTRPNGIVTDYAYDSISRLLSVLHFGDTGALGGAPGDGATYEHDNAGNRIAKNNFLDGTREEYSYDPIYELISVRGMAAPPYCVPDPSVFCPPPQPPSEDVPPPLEQYSYDAVGNRLISVSVAQYNYDTSNHLTSTSDGVSYTYDNNGNTITKTVGTATTTYAWDFENRLIQVTLPGSGGTVAFRYDPFGRRIQKGSSTGTTNFLYDGPNIIEETDATGALGARYTQALGIDEPVAMVRGGVTDFYQLDGLGSITSLADSAANVVASYKYDSFGNLVSSTGTLINPFRFTGRESDYETGLYYYRTRYYDPVNGRFISEDLRRFQAAGNNFYRYVLNNPQRYTDHFGYDADLLFDNCTRCQIFCDLKFKIDVAATGLEGFVLGFTSGVFDVAGGFDHLPINSASPDQTAEIVSGKWAKDAANQCVEKKGRCLLACALGPCNPTTTGPPTF